MAKLHPDERFCNAQIKMLIDFLSLFSEQSKLVSLDTKCKIKIGIPAVSKYVHSNKYFSTNARPIVFDHDFPIAEGMLITPAGI
jgi:hypothetical protein